MTKIAVKLKGNIAYCGLPFLPALQIVLRAGQMDGIIPVLHLLLIVFGYIASVQDIKTKKIPNKLIIAMLAAWAIMSIQHSFIDTSYAVVMLKDSALGFALGGGLFLLVYLISRKGVGGGDVKLMAAAGLYLGAYGIIPTILYGSILAALTGLILIVLKKIKRKDTIPLAPFLYAGMLITIFLS